MTPEVAYQPWNRELSLFVSLIYHTEVLVLCNKTDRLWAKIIITHTSFPLTTQRSFMCM